MGITCKQTGKMKGILQRMAFVQENERRKYRREEAKRQPKK